MAEIPGSNTITLRDFVDLAPPPVELEPKGAELKAQGIVSELYADGTALVEIPATGGGLLGVRVAVPEGTKLSSLFHVPVTVESSSEHAVKVNVETYLKEVQPIGMNGKARADLKTADAVPAPPPPITVNP